VRFVEPVTLKGRYATLEPLGRGHEAAVKAAAADGELWRLWYTSVPSPEKTSAWLETALAMRENLGAMPFVIRDNASGDIVGSTRYFNVDAAHRRLRESVIRGTPSARSARRSTPNAKLMLLTHAFEVLNCIAVEFRTHFFNFQSRAAIERLGAKQDGILRNHQIMPDGTLRDTVVFSIIDGEWPTVKRHLGHRLERTKC
jgi:RimJ/RimL family protein N-acetyltransferase